MENRHPPSYSYAPLLAATNSIRLVRLLPSSPADSPIRCQLFNYSLSTPKRGSHLYECLSYVWGSPDHKRSIIIDGARLDVTQNLHAALLRLRDPELDRVLWVDAICINQDDLKERAQQVQFMAMIFAYASRVIVWLGEEADRSSEAMDMILLRANWKSPTYPRAAHNDDTPGSGNEPFWSLLRRPWFRRIWVLQEIAAARAVSIVCGSKEMSGACFQDFLSTLKFNEGQYNVEHVTFSVAFLLSRKKVFHSLDLMSNEQFTLDIGPLSELIDKFRTRESTDHRDKLYALLEMSTADFMAESFKPDYEKDWKTIFEALLRHVLGEKPDVSLHLWKGKKYGLITSMGCVLGDVGKPGFSFWGQEKDRLLLHPYHECVTSWLLHSCESPAREGDVVCLLEGAVNPTIIRPHGEYFAVVAMAVPFPIERGVTNFLFPGSDSPCDSPQLQEGLLTWSQFLSLQLGFERKLRLVWSWDTIENPDDESTDAEFAMHEFNRLEAFSDVVRVFEDIAWRGSIGPDVVARAISIGKGQISVPHGASPHFEDIEQFSKDWDTYLVFKLIVKLALGNWARYKACDSGGHSSHSPTTSLMPDAVEIRTLFQCYPSFMSALFEELKSQVKETTHPSIIGPEWKASTNERTWDVLRFILDYYYSYLSPHQFMNAIEWIEQDDPLGCKDSRQQFSTFALVEMVVEAAERHPMWGAIFVQGLFDQLKQYSHVLYQLLTISIEGDTNTQSWRSPTMEAALGTDSATLVKTITASDVWKYAALERPFGIVLDFNVNQYAPNEGRQWLERRTERFGNLYVNHPRETCYNSD